MASTRIIEQCRVAPSPGAPAEQFLKLLHFDMLYISIAPLRSLHLYKFQCSESHFLETIVPNLKNSLSLALKHFTPLAGKILIPNNTSMPVFHYVDGEDSVPLTIAISNADNFVNLTAYHSREAEELYDLCPQQLPPPALSSTHKFPLTTFQVTLFPNKGVCIGFTYRHLICDALSLISFFHAWTSINRSNGDVSSPDLLRCLPTYDRDAVADGDPLAVEFWEVVKAFPSVTTSLPTPCRARATFLLSEAGIKTLQSRIFSDNRWDGVRVSISVVAFAYLWTCMARSAAAAGEEVGDDEPEYISLAVDCRRLLNPPLPDTYFGNCMAVALAESTHGILRGRDGFLSAVKAIGAALQRTLSNEKGIMEGSLKTLLLSLGLMEKSKRMFLVSGSPRLDFYDADFGWGRPVKFEPLLDYHPGVSVVIKSRDNRRGMEGTVVMPKPKLDAFMALFSQGLSNTEKPCCKM